VKTDARRDRLRLCADLLNRDEELAVASQAVGALVAR
jgi:hypothetical protein